MSTSPVGQFPAPPGRFLPARIASFLTTLCRRGFSPAKIPAALALLLALLGLFALVAPRTLRFNVTPSLPLGFYRLVGGPVERGSLVEICLPSGLTSLALHRGYSGKGSCPGDARPLLKTALALPGDRLVLTRLGIARHGVRAVTESDGLLIKEFDGR